MPEHIIKEDEQTSEAPEEISQEEVKAEEQERPEWLPEKFKSPEDMAKAYGELEKSFTKSRQEDAPKEAEAEEQPAEEKETLEIKPQEEQAKEVVENAGIDYDALATEYAENNGLTEETYSKLNEAGIPKDIVDQYIQGQEAIRDNSQKAIYDSVGGQDQYKNMVGWAGENLSPQEIQAYNNAVNSGNQATVALTVSGLQARYQTANGRQPSLVQGRTSAESSGSTYQSNAQIVADMSKPEYESDPAFRQEVADKIARSDI
tara:strand:+ start:1964 stop:2746 length:783 start_codon:yes stop_codon:yes gene_type:complete